MLQSKELYIVIAQQEWALNLGSNARNIAFEFSKTRDVLYVNPPLDFNTLVKQFKSVSCRNRLKIALGAGTSTVKVDDRIWVHTPETLTTSINWIKNPGLFNLLSKRNSSSYCKSLNNAIRNLGFNAENSIVFNDSQMFLGRYLKKYLNPRDYYYYIRDNLVKHPYFEKHGKRVEPETISMADYVFTNSAYLEDYAKEFNINTINIGQGCEVDMYDADKFYNEPGDLLGVPHPRIGYIGFLTGERLDIALLENLATKKKEWNWVFIGPEEIMFQKSLLHQLPNVYFLGSKNNSLLPKYLKHLDVCINPQLVNDLTIGNYPRKIDEYLAMGKPIVATDTPAMKMFSPYVNLASGLEDYIKAIEKALKPRTPVEVHNAILFARSHTWEASINKIYQKKNVGELNEFK